MRGAEGGGQEGARAGGGGEREDPIAEYVTDGYDLYATGCVPSRECGGSWRHGVAWSCSAAQMQA